MSERCVIQQRWNRATDLCRHYLVVGLLMIGSLLAFPGTQRLVADDRDVSVGPTRSEPQESRLRLALLDPGSETAGLLPFLRRMFRDNRSNFGTDPTTGKVVVLADSDQHRRISAVMQCWRELQPRVHVGLTTTLKVSDSSIGVGEPIVVTLSVTNNSDQVQMFPVPHLGINQGCLVFDDQGRRSLPLILDKN